jgi:hypothetical protein
MAALVNDRAAGVPQAPSDSVKTDVVIDYLISPCIRSQCHTISRIATNKIRGVRANVADRIAVSLTADQNAALLVAQRLQAKDPSSDEAAEDPVVMRSSYYCKPIASIARKSILRDHRTPRSANYIVVRGTVNQEAIAAIGQRSATVGR